MKHLKTIVTTLLCMAAAVTATAGTKTVKVTEPGTLQQLVEQKKLYGTEQMKVSGRLNGTDLLFLADMAGRDHLHNRASAGRLRRLYMGGVTIQPGKVPFGKGSITVNDSASLIGGLFCNTLIEEIELPRAVSKLGGDTFKDTPLRRISLPENAEVGDSAFARCSKLSEVVFPSTTCSLGMGCFAGCNALRNISMHNVFYIAYHAFADMPSLETISIGGTLGHIDGWAFFRLPQLRSVTFGTDIITTGGPGIAQECPQLSVVSFGGVGLESSFADAPGCPLLKQIQGGGIFLYAHGNGMVKGVNGDVKLVSEAQRTKVKSHIASVLQKPWARSVFYGGGALYNAACFFSLCGDSTTAVNLLSKAVDYGYSNYRGTIADTDFNNIRNSEGFKACLARLREVGDYIHLLQTCAPYAPGSHADGGRFTYASPTDSDMVRVRQYFRLDSIAGSGDEQSKMKRILAWLHNTIRHDGQNGIPNVPRNSIALYEACKASGRGLNCRGLAIILSELYMSMGWPSRFITCESKAYDTDTDCHVIDMVWSSKLGKWIWMDPTFNAYVTDENGVMLHPGEVRLRIASGGKLVLNDDANWNNEQKLTKEYYLDAYMAKNLYIISAYQYNGFGTEGSGKSEYITLAPNVFNAKRHKCTADDEWFWQKPDKKQHANINKLWGVEQILCTPISSVRNMPKY